MSKKFKIVLLLIVACLAVTGCNSKKKKNHYVANGSVVFFQNIDNTGTLQLKALNTSQRNSYGTAEYLQFSDAVTLPAGQWQVKVVDDKSTANTADDETVLESGAFSVTANALRLIAFTENLNGDKQLVTAPLASAGSINVTHLDKNLAEVTVYIIPVEVAGADVETFLSTADAEQYKLAPLDFAKTSASWSLASLNADGEAYVYVVNENDAVVIETGIRQFKKDTQQTLLLASGNGLRQFVYYHAGESALWMDKANQLASVRAVNTYDGALSVNAICGADSALDTVLDAALAKEAVSTAQDLDAEQCFYSLEAEDTANNASVKNGAYLLAMEQWTMVYFGDAATAKLQAIKVKEPAQVLSGRAGITVTNAVYFTSGDTVKAVDVYLLKPGQNPAGKKAFFDKLQQTKSSFGRFAADDATATAYQIIVAEAGTMQTSQPVVIAQGALSLQGNENYHLVVHGANGLQQGICLVDEVAGQCISL